MGPNQHPVSLDAKRNISHGVRRVVYSRGMRERWSGNDVEAIVLSAHCLTVASVAGLLALHLHAWPQLKGNIFQPCITFHFPKSNMMAPGPVASSGGWLSW